MGEVIIWAALAVLVIACLRNIISDLKHGTCSGCSSCGHCSHCGGDHDHCSHGGGYDSSTSGSSGVGHTQKSVTNDDLRRMLGSM
jgi:hypothetical protein